MNKLKIEKEYIGISKTLRPPENMVDTVQALANLKNISFNKAIITLVGFALENLDDDDKTQISNNAKYLLTSNSANL